MRAAGLDVELLRQRYTRLTDLDEPAARFAYDAPELRFSEELEFGADGFVLRYPGLGHRAEGLPLGTGPLLRLTATLPIAS